MRNVHNLLSYGVVGKSVCRMWESCTLAFPCSANGLFHDGIVSYTHFHGAGLMVFSFFGSEYCGAGGLSLLLRNKELTKSQQQNRQLVFAFLHLPNSLFFLQSAL